jgi:hypothetical protein
MMLVDKDCWERGCACYDSRIDTDAVNLNKVGWIRAIDEEMVAAHLGIASIDDSYAKAKTKLNSLINWHIATATDPYNNGGYQLQNVNRIRDLVEQAGFYITEKNGQQLTDYAYQVIAECLAFCNDKEALLERFGIHRTNTNNPIDFPK